LFIAKKQEVSLDDFNRKIIILKNFGVTGKITEKVAESVPGINPRNKKIVLNHSQSSATVDNTVTVGDHKVMRCWICWLY
jgi:hypothetical protein